jgi:rubredoxin
VLRLRYYVCGSCGTVYADVAEPPACDGCPDGGPFRDLTGRLLEDMYFTRGLGED